MASMLHAAPQMCTGMTALVRYAPPTTQLGRETVNALTFEVDQSPGAGHRVDLLATDALPRPDLAQALEAAGVEVEVAD